MRFSISILFLLLISLTACEEPDSLEAIAGVTGVVQFNPVWPDSLAGAVIAVFDKGLDFARIDDPDYQVIDYFITYGDPISPGVESADYFIQLEPGEYQLMVIGLLVDPAQLLANEELFQNIQNYIVVPEYTAPRGIIIQEKQILEQTLWSVQF